MASGLFALLDDVAVLAKAAAASIDDVGAAAARASAKAVGVVVDDTAVTPRYVQGIAAERELPIIKKIAVGSLRNKIIFILPAIMLLSQFAEWAVTPLLMLGATFLCYEGAEKIWEKLLGHAKHAEETGPVDEQQVVTNATRTDFILSTEIMVISLNEVTSEPFFLRLVVLLVVAVVITLLVYGVVGLIVKMDDGGLKLAQSESPFWQKFGRGLVAAMPKVLNVLSVVGVVAMLWVGGHILLVGMDDLGFSAPYDLVHHIEEPVAGIAGVGGILGWIVNTLCSAILGFIVGSIVVLIVTPIRNAITRRKEHKQAAAPAKPAAADKAAADDAARHDVTAREPGQPPAGTATDSH
ncbi:DUF808 domain-containing protein [Nakamurella aerolata]|uniref:DUF808 domain-containing protein n=1 Tax=Nakamurella aerolata TaxID=1656892 RepID=A0A849A6K5_9ACTN|nr:DUF808 domain-containing protein [Nakamurella aerolata]NNG36145.1 DUF808 domain-containing protein [Nakamurella aerolata]